MIKEKPIYVTNLGLAELKKELAHLRTVKRPEIVEQMQEAKGNGDWMDQTEYMLVEAELGFIDGRIQELQHMLDNAEIIEQGNEDNVVNIGETVTLQASDGEIEQYTIVGVAEANPSQGFISNESPLGQALLDHLVGEEVIVHAPAGEIRYRILTVTPRTQSAN
ncbi:transcription elongation factor GreA [Candidatus Leptofilum sp.]|uniref:transcription elongation factor GreA n=1 Tax=Candidatus Leptofilum sp. TaxID=3241576 RepID=UPI003B596D5B